MSLVETVVEDAAIGVAVAESPSSLNAFLRPGCAAAIWRRQIPRTVQAWLNGLGGDLLPRSRIVLRPRAAAQLIEQACDIAGLPDGPERQWFETDIAALVRVFADLMAAKYVRLRLEAVDTNACRKFHIDAITGRLVCTYRGPGTQYGISTSGRDPQRIFSVATGSPILLRGTLWPEGPATGLLHRSPPIEGTGETRLVLVLDPVSELEDGI